MCVVPGEAHRPVRHTSHALSGRGLLGSCSKNEVNVCVHNRTERKQLRTYTWNCSLLYNFNITILEFLYVKVFIYLEF